MIRIYQYSEAATDAQNRARCPLASGRAHGMRAGFTVLLLLLALPVFQAAGTDDDGDELRISNSVYTLRWDTDSEQIMVQGTRSANCGIASFSLTGRVVDVTKGRTGIPHLGFGPCWKLHHKDGSVTTIVLMNPSPFTDDPPWIAVRKSAANEGVELRKIDKLEVIQARLSFGAPTSQLVARGTAGLYPLEKNYGSYVFSAVADPESGSGVVFGWASNLRGQGIVFSEVDGDAATMRARVDYGDLQLPVGGSEEAGEWLLIGVFDDVREGLEQYAEATASLMQIKLRPLPSVYCTWYHAGASDEQRLAKNTDFAATQLAPWGLKVMQIDDRWQPGLKDNGPKRIFTTHDPEGPYPHGMKATADHIRAQGMVPGIWFMPFSGTWLDPYFADKQDLFYKVGRGDPSWTRKEMANQNYETDTPIEDLPYSTHWAGTAIDCTNAKSRQYIRDMVHRISHEWGYKYFKMDGFHTGSGSRQRYIDNQYQEDDLGKTVRHDPMMTPIEGYRLGMQVIRDAAGEDVFFLGCCQVQNLRSFGTTFGMLDAMRVGPDNGARWANADRGPRYGGRYYFLNKRVWHCDPDPFYVRPSLTYSQATTLASWVALAGQLTASSNDYYDLPPERLDIIRRVMPTHNVKSSRPIDFLQRDVPHEWLLTDNGRVVVGHFNWSENEEISLSTPLEKLGLDPSRPHVGFDYWGNQFVTVDGGKLQHTLPPGSCKIISLYPAAEHPQLVSTSRHVTQGIVDVLMEDWDSERQVLSGTSNVVALDPYELRVAVPKDSNWSAVRAWHSRWKFRDEVKISPEENGVRIEFLPAETGTIHWTVRFEKR